MTRGNATDSSLYIKSRPLQGQSPYIINSGIQYLSLENGWSVTVNYNKIGPRIYIVGSKNEPDIWEQGRDMIDLQLGKSLLKNRLDVRMNIQNLLAQKQYFFQDHNHNEKFDKDVDQTIWMNTFGRIVSFSAAYKF